MTSSKSLASNVSLAFETTTTEGRPHLWEPFEGKPQADAFRSDADELYYGGAAGGGKTDLGLGVAIETHKRSLILRRELEQAKDIIDRSDEIIGSAARYNANHKIWRFPDGRQIEFGGLQREKDWRKYRGRPKDLYVFDELPEFLESQYRSIIAWNRSVDPDQRTRVIATGNPPTDEEGAWVMDYWSAWLDPEHDDPAAPGELRWFVRQDDEDVQVDGPEPVKYKDETLYPRSRTFIPAMLHDNPVLSATPEYEGVLQGLMEPLRSQLLYGDFEIGLKEDAFRLIPRDWLELAFQRHENDYPNGPKTGLTAIGCDPSRGGKDACVLYPRFAEYYGEPESYQGEDVNDGPKVATLIVKMMGDRNVPVNIDPIGIGSSPHDALLANEIDSRAVNAAARAVNFKGTRLTDRSGRFTFKNIRAAMHWRLRESLDPESGDNLAIPRSSKLKRELLAIGWKVTTAGIAIEEKKDIVDRIGRSPDHAEALMLANYADALVGSWDDVAELGSVDREDSPWR